MKHSSIFSRGIYVPPYGMRRNHKTKAIAAWHAYYHFARHLPLTECKFTFFF